MRRLTTSFVQLAASSLIGQLIGFAVLALVARRIGPSNLGAYGFASNFMTYVSLPLPGIGVLAIREIAQHREQGPDVIGDLLLVIVPYGAVMCGAIYLLAPYIAPTPVASTMLRILAISEVITLLTLDWVLQAIGAFRILALIRLVGQVVYGSASVFLITSGATGAYRYAWLNALGLTVVLLGTWIYSARLVGGPHLHTNLRRAADLVQRGAAFSIGLVMTQIYYSIDFVLLGFLASGAAVGEYLVAYKLPMVIIGFAVLWINVFYPHAATQTRPRLRYELGMFSTLAITIAIPLCAGGLALGTPLIELLFGSQYAAAGLYFKLLLISASLAVVGVNFEQGLLATGHERTFALGVTCAAVVNVVLNLAFIPLLGPEGSALATIAAQIVVLVFGAVRVARVLGVPPIAWSRVVRSAIAAVIMVLLIESLLSGWPVLPRVFAGTIVYAVIAIATGAIRGSDYRREDSGTEVEGRRGTALDDVTAAGPYSREDVGPGGR